MDKPRITGIVCTRDREAFLGKCLDSMLKQTLARDEFEVLVVNNGSSDGTATLLEKYQSQGVVIVDEPVPGLSKARNTGWKHAKGTYVGYLDDDGVAEDKWFEFALSAFETVSPSPEWVGGPIELDCQVSLPAWIDHELRVPLGEVNWGKEPRFLVDQERLGGGNSFFPKALLKDVGGFEEALGRDGKSLLSADETELQHRVQARGGRLYYHPGVKMRHFVGRERVQPGWFYRRYFWGGVSDVIMSRTLQGVKIPEALDSAKVTQSNSRAGRAIKSLLLSLGLSFDTHKTIRARVYMAYVFGYFWGVLRSR